MDYGKLLNRAWDIIWRHKYLIVLGILVALSSGLGSGTSSSSGFRFDGDRGPFGPGGWRDLTPFQDVGLPMIWPLLLVGLALIVALIFWVVATISRGGLIAGADAADRGESFSFSQAWSAGWRRGWTLLGIGVVAAIPGFIALLLGVLGFFVYATDVGSRMGPRLMGPVIPFGVGLACILLPLALILGLLRAVANRACMLEELGVFASYGRGIRVLFDNLGQALILFLIQIAVSIAMFILLFVPGILIALCCLLWPLLLIVQGAVTAYFSTLWTLAWRQWTVEPEPSVAQPV